MFRQWRHALVLLPMGGLGCDDGRPASRAIGENARDASELDASAHDVASRDVVPDSLHPDIAQPPIDARIDALQDANSLDAYDGYTEDRDAPPDASNDVTDLAVEGIAVGENVACAVFTGGLLRCWGDFRLVMGASRPSPIPIKVDNGGGYLKDVAEVHASYRHACARLFDGRFACWGFNNEYQIGDFTRESTFDAKTTTMARFVRSSTEGGLFLGPTASQGTGRICAGVAHSAAVGNLDTAYTWGYIAGSENLVLGRGKVTKSQAIAPMPVLAPLSDPLPADDSLRGVREVRLGTTHACASLESNRVVCWGDNGSGKLGLGHNMPITDGRPRHVQVPDTVALVKVAVGANSACAITGLGRVRCWGENTRGQAGKEPIGSQQWDVSADVKIGDATALSEVEEVGVGGSFACARQKTSSGGRVYCWGTGTDYVRGDGITAAIAVATPVAGQLQPTRTDLTGARLLAVGRSSSCVVIGRRDVRCWGSGPIGERGQSSSTSTVPRSVDDL